PLRTNPDLPARSEGYRLPSRRHDHHSQWRHGKGYRQRLPVLLNLFCQNPPTIAVVGTSIAGRIAIENFPPAPCYRYTHAIASTYYGCEVGYHQQGITAGALAQPRKGAVGAVVSDQPLEAGRVAVKFMQRRFLSVQTIEIAQ